LTFDPVPDGTRMRWSWQVETPGAMKLLAPLVGRMGRRQERRVRTSLKRPLEGQSPAGKAGVRGIGRAAGTGGHSSFPRWRSSGRIKWAGPIAASEARRPAGKRVKPSVWASGEKGSSTPIVTQTSVAANRGLLGRLRKKGTRRVRMAKIARLWVASDSTNQPERNRVALALKAQSRIAKVAKSKSELIGPKKVMKRRIRAVSQWAGRCSCSSSTLSVGIVISLTS